jgi:transcriptional regulator GlxA family with amidase domain
MKLSILLTQNYRLLSLAAVVDVFEMVNRFCIEEDKDPAFEIRFVGNELPQGLPGHFGQYPFTSFSEINEPLPLLLIPAFGSEDMQQTIEANVQYIPFLVQQYQMGASLVSLCTGSFLLAAGGLLNGRQATTHIEAVDRFAQIFPEVKLQPHAVVTQCENIYTSGGATSSFHMKLLLIQQYCGREMAIRIAKMFSIDMDRNNQLYFEHFKPSLSSEDQLVRAVQMAIGRRFGEIKNVEEALEEVPSSRRNIIRRFKQATGMTPIRYLQKTKIEAAKKLLETTDKDIMEVMVASGYNDLKNFRQLFKSFTGLTPKDYREKYGMRLQ